MNMSLRFLGPLCVLFFSITAPVLLPAKHIIGGSITYECLGEVSPGMNQYRFTMKVYRDCLGGGAEFDNPAEFAIYRGTTASNSLFESFQVNFSKFTPLVPDTPNCVQDIPLVCVEEATYVFTRTLSISQNDSYFIVYQRCCRNESISNLVSPGDLGATYMIELTPAAQQACNNSPVFTNFPPIIICSNVPLEFDHSATDVDGDQLVYSFCPPLLGGGNILNTPGLFSCDGAVPTPPCGPPFDNAPFVVPTYSAANPMGGNPQVKINGTTGMITGTPNLLKQFVVAVCVREFRNGVLLSTVQREFQFNVADCSPTVLAVIDTAVLAGGAYEINACGNKSVKIGNESFEKSKISFFEWRFDLNGTIYSNSEESSWNALNITFPDTGSYTGYLFLNPGDICGDTAKIIVNVYPAVHADFTYDYDTCVAGPVVFTDKSSGEGIIETWNWDFGVPGGTSSEVNPEYLYGIPGNHPVNLRVTDRNHCQDDTTQVINWFPVPPLILIQPDAFLGCTPADIFFNNLSTPIDESYQIIWDFGDGDTIKNVISPTHTYTVPGTYDVGVSITSPIGCHISDQFNNLIRVEPSPTANFTFDPLEGLSNLNNTVQFTDLSLDANRWNWQFDRFGTTTERNPDFTFPDTGLMTIRLIVTHPEGCQDSITKTLDIRPEIRWFMPNAFTPNGDSHNEEFLGKGFMFGASGFQMTIWNRWGELVYETNSPTDAWNGRQKNTGEMSPAGVYVYLVTFTGPRGEPYEFRGFATLVR